MDRRWFGKKQPEKPVDDEVLVFMPVPSLISKLMAHENMKGSALTEEEVLRTAGDCIGVAVAPSMVASMAQSRGYDEIDLDDVWGDWQCHVAARDAEQTGGDTGAAAAATNITMTGDVEVFLRALGTPPGDPAFEAAVAQAGSVVVIKDSCDPPSRCWSFTDGVQFLVEGELLDAVFVRLRPDPSVGGNLVYPRADALIEGISSFPDEREVRGLFGAPESEIPPHPTFQDRMVSGVRYKVCGRSVHFSFDDEGQVELITLMASAVG